jgi:hypothetical protein
MRLAHLVAGMAVKQILYSPFRTLNCVKGVRKKHFRITLPLIRNLTAEGLNKDARIKQLIQFVFFEKMPAGTIGCREWQLSGIMFTISDNKMCTRSKKCTSGLHYKLSEI